ncbi:GrpE protein-like [Quillaja saponaria]|uniref:GrpE protein homolog n=1 Tax=Quillaja saponaria TaxID=32244 RepID=A0AAD7VDT4_QUISA|nr:GrpE protein-like [Quillaja saponaria]
MKKQLSSQSKKKTDSSNGAISVEDHTSDDKVFEAKETPTSLLITLFQSYKEALANNDESKVADVESLLKSIEEEKVGLEGKVASLSEELSAEKARILRISADFEISGKGPRGIIKVETEGEEKINNSYQSIYKQFMEILGSLGVVPVETIGNPFDPLLHEAIMREDSTEYEEAIIIEEYRKGFRLGDRLLRPSMVKVSAGPGLAKPEQVAPPED